MTRQRSRASTAINGCTAPDASLSTAPRADTSTSLPPCDCLVQPKHYREDLVGAALANLAAAHNVHRRDVWLQTKFTPLAGQDRWAVSDHHTTTQCCGVVVGLCVSMYVQQRACQLPACRLIALCLPAVLRFLSRNHLLPAHAPPRFCVQVAAAAVRPSSPAWSAGAAVVCHLAAQPQHRLPGLPGAALPAQYA